MIALKFPGYYQGAAGKWLKSKEKYCWQTLMEKCPSICAKYDEVPNWLRSRMDINQVKGPGHTKIVSDIYDVVDQILMQATREGLELNVTSIEEVLSDSLEANAVVSKWRSEREAADLKAVENLTASGATEAEVKQLVSKQEALKAAWPAPVRLGNTARSINQLALNFAEKYGFSMFAQSKPTRHLQRDHPQVQHVMDFIQMTIRNGEVDERLVLNFDQVWSCLQLVLSWALSFLFVNGFSKDSPFLLNNLIDGFKNCIGPASDLVSFTAFFVKRECSGMSLCGEHCGKPQKLEAGMISAGFHGGKPSAP